MLGAVEGFVEVGTDRGVLVSSEAPLPLWEALEAWRLLLGSLLDGLPFGTWSASGSASGLLVWSPGGGRLCARRFRHGESPSWVGQGVVTPMDAWLAGWCLGLERLERSSRSGGAPEPFTERLKEELAAWSALARRSALAPLGALATHEGPWELTTQSDTGWLWQTTLFPRPWKGVDFDADEGRRGLVMEGCVCVEGPPGRAQGESLPLLLWEDALRVLWGWLASEAGQPSRRSLWFQVEGASLWVEPAEGGRLLVGWEGVPPSLWSSAALFGPWLDHVEALVELVAAQRGACSARMAAMVASARRCRERLAASSRGAHGADARELVPSWTRAARSEALNAGAFPFDASDILCFGWRRGPSLRVAAAGMPAVAWLDPRCVAVGAGREVALVDLWQTQEPQRFRGVLLRDPGLGPTWVAVPEQGGEGVRVTRLGPGGPDLRGGHILADLRWAEVGQMRPVLGAKGSAWYRTERGLVVVDCANASRETLAFSPSIPLEGLAPLGEGWCAWSPRGPLWWWSASAQGAPRAFGDPGGVVHRQWADGDLWQVWEEGPGSGFLCERWSCAGEPVCERWILPGRPVAVSCAAGRVAIAIRDRAGVAVWIAGEGVGGPWLQRLGGDEPVSLCWDAGGGLLVAERDALSSVSLAGRPGIAWSCPLPASVTPWCLALRGDVVLVGGEGVGLYATVDGRCLASEEPFWEELAALDVGPGAHALIVERGLDGTLRVHTLRRMEVLAALR